MNDNGYTEDQQEVTGEKMDDLRVRWRSLNNNKDTKKNKYRKRAVFFLSVRLENALIIYNEYKIECIKQIVF